MSRKSKATRRDGSSSSSSTSRNKKMKVSSDDGPLEKEGEEPPVVMIVEEQGKEVEAEDEGPWDGIRVIHPPGKKDNAGEEEVVLCRSDGCDEKATATWASQKTGEHWDMCDKCQLQDFGECYRGSGEQQPHQAAPLPPPSGGTKNTDNTIGTGGSEPAAEDNASQSSPDPMDEEDNREEEEEASDNTLVDPKKEESESSNLEGDYDYDPPALPESNVDDKATDSNASSSMEDNGKSRKENHDKESQQEQQQDAPTTVKNPILDGPADATATATATGASNKNQAQLSSLVVSDDSSSSSSSSPSPPGSESASVASSAGDIIMESEEAAAAAGEDKDDDDDDDDSSSPATKATTNAAPELVTQTQTQTQTQDDDSSPMKDGNGEDGEEGEDDEEGQYDLKKILSLQDLSKDDTICCSQDACGGLPAFGLYVNSHNPKDRWYYCLDCQENDFDGWPPIQDLPVPYLDAEHLRVMARKCSNQKNPPMPVFPPSSSSSSSSCSSLTPPKSRPATNSNNTDPADAGSITANFVTPPPPHSASSALVVGVMESSNHRHPRTAGGGGGGPAPKALNPLGKTKALEVHKKWLEAAQAMGGMEARIVVGKPAAKKLIFDFLYDAFRPMNITQIYKGLKAVVPQPVLNACLQDMVPDKFDGKNPFDGDSSDEEEDEGGSKHAKNKSNHTNKENEVPYSASLIFKPGKNLSTNLYFCDYHKIKAMDRDERETLMNDLAIAKTEKQALDVTLKSTMAFTAQLLAEPTNEELTLKLESAETLLTDLEEQVGEARKLKVNEKHKEQTKKRIQTMAVHWRERRRLCLEFLTGLEENTDGAVSRAKCLKGDGQIALDSDEAVAEAAVRYAKDKRSKAAARNKMVGSHHNQKRNKGRGGGIGSQSKAAVTGGSGGGLLEEESDLVGVTLDMQLNVVRVYATED